MGCFEESRDDRVLLFPVLGLSRRYSRFLLASIVFILFFYSPGETDLKTLHAKVTVGKPEQGARLMAVARKQTPPTKRASCILLSASQPDF